MKTLLTTTAIVLALGVGTANATPATAIAAAGAVSKNTTNTTVLNKQQLANINSAKASGGGGGGGGGGGNSDLSDNSSNDTKVDGSYGLALSFPPSAIGNGPWGSWGFGWNLFTSTYLSEEVLDANTVSNVIMFYAETDDPAKSATLEKVLASYMCASERKNVRAGGGLIFGDLGYSGCMTAAE